MKHKTMETISEKVKDKEVLKTMKNMYFKTPRHETKDRGVDSHTLHIFDHKVADYLSTLDDVYSGGVLCNKDGKKMNASRHKVLEVIDRNSYLFVPSTYPCYKPM